MQRIRVLAGLWLMGASLVFAGGCGGGGSDPAESISGPGQASNNGAAADATDASDAGFVAGSGEPAELQGRIIFQGTIPPPRKVSVTKDIEYCGKFAGERQEVDVSESGGLKNAVVEIRGLEEPADGWAWEQPAEGYVVHQKGCAFEPPLLVLPDGEQLKVFNDDPVSHSINTGQWNVTQLAGAEPVKLPLRGKQPIRVACSIHSWMEGWVYLAQSPYYTITDEAGEFRIQGVPPGEYRITLWHPSLRTKREKVKLPAGEVVKQDFEFESPF